MSSKGELKKRIFGLFGYPQDPSLDPEDEPFANDLNKILDEVKKDFPTYTQAFRKRKANLKYRGDELQPYQQSAKKIQLEMTLEWFKKWFGEP